MIDCVYSAAATAKVVLHALSAVHKEVVVRLVVPRAVVIVDVFLRAVVVDEEIVVNLPPGHVHRRGAVCHRCLPYKWAVGVASEGLGASVSCGRKVGLRVATVRLRVITRKG